jgi:hypothetical protein
MIIVAATANKEPVAKSYAEPCIELTTYVAICTSKNVQKNVQKNFIDFTPVSMTFFSYLNTINFSSKVVLQKIVALCRLSVKFVNSSKQWQKENLPY